MTRGANIPTQPGVFNPVRADDRPMTRGGLGGFHQNYLKGKTLGIACPKLDSNQEIYKLKIKSLIDDARINTLTVMIMEVPCCGGLLRIAQSAVAEASRKIPVKLVIVSTKGEILKEDWL